MPTTHAEGLQITLRFDNSLERHNSVKVVPLMSIVYYQKKKKKTYELKYAKGRST